MLMTWNVINRAEAQMAYQAYAVASTRALIQHLTALEPGEQIRLTQ